jgi:hypothetical protein
MNAPAKRLVRLEERLTPVDYAGNPRVRHRLTVTNIGKQLSLETSRCRRTLSAGGSLFEIVRLDGTRDGFRQPKPPSRSLRGIGFCRSGAPAKKPALA